MAEKTKDPQAPAPVPPLESSPEFQARTQDALGGPPLQPSSFGPISTLASQPGEGPTRRQAPIAPERAHDPAFDGPAADLRDARALVASLPPALNQLRVALGLNLALAQDLVAKIQDNKLAKDEAMIIGLDLAAAEKFLTALSKAHPTKK